MFKRLLYIFLFLFAGVAAFAQQYPVQGSFAIASPYPANLSDYANSSIQNVALNLTLTDLAMNNKRVRLKLFIQTQNSTIAQSIDNISGEPLIMLDGGIPQRFTNNELAHYFRLENLQGINPDAYARSLPEGIYTFGFEVYDYFTGNKLSGRISQTFWIIINDPPLLNTPTDKSKIADFTSGSGGNGGIIFNWTPRSTQVTNTEYEFTLCELWDPAGDPYQQFMSAIPKYQTTVSNTTTLIYSLAQPTLISGYTYAWRVRAKAKAGFEDIGLYRNDGYSNLFTFRYGDPCPPPQSLVLETKTSDQISATWQAPLTTVSGSGEAYKIAYRKYTIAGQWNWAESETSNLFLTISNLEPATEYEIKVGVPCNDGNSAAPLFPGRGDEGEVIYTPSQRATTLPAGQIAGIECGKEPVIDLSNQKLIENLKVGDVVMANDHPHTLTRVTGSSQGWSGESWSKESLLGGLKLKFRFSNIKVNTDKQLIDGYFESVYDDNLSNIINPGEVVNSMINDVTTLVDDINALTTKIDDFISIIDKRNPTTEEINNLSNYINTNKQTILDNLKNTSGEAAMQKADSAFQEIQEGIDCLRNEEAPTEVVTPATHGPHAAEMSSATDCKKKIRNGEGTIQQLQNGAANAGKIVCGCPQDIAQSILNGDCESIKMRIEAIKAAYTKKQKIMIYKCDELSGRMSIGDVCFEKLYYYDHYLSGDSISIDPTKYTVTKTTNSAKSYEYWAIVFEGDVLELKVLATEADAEKKIRALAKWLGTSGATETTKPVSFPIKGTQLKEIFPGTDIKRCEEVAKLINKYSDKFEINTPERMALFLGQIGAETGLKDLSENSYSASTIPNAKKTRTTRLHNGKRILKYCSLFEGSNPNGSGCPYPYCENDIIVPEGSYTAEKSGANTIYYATTDFMRSLKIKSSMTDQRPDDADFFNTVYACQLSNGGIDSGDGYRFRGRGFLQITGYCNYESKVQVRWDIVHGKGDKDFLCRTTSCDANLDAIADDLDFSMQISLTFWKASKINSIAKNTSDDTIKAVSKEINGASIGIENRKLYTTKAYEVLKK